MILNLEGFVSPWIADFQMVSDHPRDVCRHTGIRLGVRYALEKCKIFSL